MKVFYYVISAIILFIVGYALYEDFYTYSVSYLQLGQLTIETRSIEHIRIGRFTLAIILALLPLFHLLVTRASNLNSRLKHFVSIFVTIISGIIFWRLRIVGLNAELKILSNHTYTDGIAPTIKIEELKFDIYLLMGFIVGTLIVILIFRDRSKPLLD